MRLAVLLAALIGCGKGEALPADCATVGNGVKQYWADFSARSTDAEERTAAAETARLTAARLERHCKADRWNDDMIACARAVFRLEDSGCMKFMSASQKAKLEEGEAVPIEGGMGIGN